MTFKLNLISVPHINHEEKHEEFIKGLCEALGLESVLLLGVGRERGRAFTSCLSWAGQKDLGLMLAQFLKQHPEVIPAVMIMQLIQDLAEDLEGGDQE